MTKIDLHMHTTYSDGANSVKQLLSEATSAKLETISITDHSNVDAYFELQMNNNYTFLYSGKIIKGVEIYSYYEGKVIEFLVYGYDLKRMKNFLDEKYGEKWRDNRVNTVLDKLKAVCNKKGIIFEKDFTIHTSVGECAQFYKHIISFEENKKHIAPIVLSGEKSFFRYEVCNKDSEFYVDYSKFYVQPKELIDFAKKIGGTVFLAHPYYYNFKDTDKLLNFVKSLGIDGIECYYPTFTKEQVEHLLNYCKINCLKISGGSDYHGGDRPNKLGKLSEKQIEYKHFNWIEDKKE